MNSLVNSIYSVTPPTAIIHSHVLCAQGVMQRKKTFVLQHLHNRGNESM